MSGNTCFPSVTTRLWLIKAFWTGTSFANSLNFELLDNRSSNTDWFDRIGLSYNEDNLTDPDNRAEIAAVWQKDGIILTSEGFLNHSSSTKSITFYNEKQPIFPIISGVVNPGTFKHPDISLKSSIYTTIVAIETNASGQKVVAYDFQNGEDNPSAYTPSFTRGTEHHLVLYSTTNSCEELRMPRV